MRLKLRSAPLSRIQIQRGREMDADMKEIDEWIDSLGGDPIDEAMDAAQVKKGRRAHIRKIIEGVLRASRNEVIEMCESIATKAAVDEDVILPVFEGRPDLVGAWQDACNHIAEAIRSLKDHSNG